MTNMPLDGTDLSGLARYDFIFSENDPYTWLVVITKDEEKVGYTLISKSFLDILDIKKRG